jgi:hypothetical protein
MWLLKTSVLPLAFASVTQAPVGLMPSANLNLDSLILRVSMLLVVLLISLPASYAQVNTGNASDHLHMPRGVSTTIRERK